MLMRRLFSPLLSLIALATPAARQMLAAAASASCEAIFAAVTCFELMMPPADFRRRLFCRLSPLRFSRRYALASFSASS